jgi:hypothetical protein
LFTEKFKGKSKKLIYDLEARIDHRNLSFPFSRVKQFHQFGVFEAKLLPQHYLPNPFVNPEMPLVEGLVGSHGFFV